MSQFMQIDIRVMPFFEVPFEKRFPHLVELFRRLSYREVLKKELLGMAKGSDLTKEIKDLLFQDSFPVDIRHNAKIFREKQTVWARGQLE